jgi:hypothetical protein
LRVQVASRGERAPHVVLASFSLHYLQPEERSAFFALLSAKAERPFLLLIIKGVGEKQRPQCHVRSVFFGLHYYVGEDKHARVIEAHACLIMPSAPKHGGDAVDDAKTAGDALPGRATVGSETMGRVAEGIAVGRKYDPDDPDSWVLCTFETLERRCAWQGLRVGTTLPEKAIELTGNRC